MTSPLPSAETVRALDALSADACARKLGCPLAYVKRVRARRPHRGRPPLPGRAIVVDLPTHVDRWVRSTAAERGVSPAEIVRKLVCGQMRP